VRYWFVRHGESVANAEGWLAGHRDAPLTRRGVSQARGVAAALAEIRPQRVLASDLCRAAETARLAWGDRAPPIEQCLAVRERNLGAWEGAVIAELRRTGGHDVLLSWERGPPGGESHQALARRALGFLVEREGAGDTLIFAHGGWIRTVVGLVDGVRFDQLGRIKVANVELLEREVAPGTWARLLASVG
jgi:2,3-bisphosphoglycerate-dependent phosphoglycerate mutase